MTPEQLIAFKRLSNAREEVIRQARDFVREEGSGSLYEAVSELEYAEKQHRNAEAHGRLKRRRSPLEVFDP